MSRRAWGTLGRLWLAFAAFAVFPLLMLRVLLVLEPLQGAGWPALESALALTAYGVGALWATRWWISRPLDASSPEALLRSYRTAFFAGLAFADAPVIAGLAGAFLTGRVWVYGVGMILAIPGFVMIAPTPHNLDRRQAELAASGSSLSLTEVLRGRG